MKSEIWNPWHGCRKFSEGCKNCYVYRRDGSVGRDASEIRKTSYFYLPRKRDRRGDYKIPPGSEVFACMTSDFFLPEADEWRGECWEMIKERQDLSFFIITKRISRFNECKPADWGEGYPNVAVCCTMENQKRCDERFPVFLELPIKKKFAICEPLLSDIDMSAYLTDEIISVTAGGESGYNARICDFEWILHLREQCVKAGVGFWFKQTGARFKKDGRVYVIKRRYQHSQARKANININKRTTL